MTGIKAAIWARRALLPEGWAADVSVGIGPDGRIAQVTPATQPGPGDVRVETLLPAPANLHSHAFQRAMAGLTERRGDDPKDSFWTWRRLMYRFLDRLTPEDVEAIAAFVVLCGLQFVIAWAAVRSERVRALVASEPALLAWEGRVLPDALKRERVAVEELRSVLRAAGRTSLEGVRAVVLETDGSFSVVGADEGDGAPRSGAGDPFLALDGVVAPKGLGPAHLRQR